jgi:4-hydroxy-2-oxoheptanedioate aldolase
MAVKFGGWSQLAQPVVIEALGKADVDFVGLDLQHGWFAFNEAASAIQLLDALGVPAYVRLSYLDLPLVPRVLDAGASGVIVAMVDDAATAARAVVASRYQPHGDRSYGGQRYGLRPEPPDVADVRPEVFVMIETKQALDAVEEIAAVEGLTGLFVGPVDLALALGAETGPSGALISTYVSPSGPSAGQGGSVPAALLEAEARPWRQALDRVVAAAHTAGLEAGMFAASGADAAYWGAAGFDRVSISSDVALLRAALDDAFRLARTAPPRGHDRREHPGRGPV